MFQAIRDIQTAFRSAGLKCGVENTGGNWVLQSGMTGKKATYHFLFIKEDDQGNDVAVRVIGLATIPKHRFDNAYEVLNRLQKKFRFIRFTLRSDGIVVVEYDFPATFEPIGKGAVEILIRLTQILDDCYPELMRATWS